MERNIKIYPIYKLFSYDILFYYAISLLYLANVKGLSLSQIALASSIYSVASIAWQLPASLIADKLGLRNSLVLGNICCLIYGILYIVAPSFPFLVCADVICALGFALKGASESPFIYSTLKKLGRVSEFSKIEGKGSSLYFIAEAIACIAAGYLFTINNYLPLIFSAICFLIPAILSFYMKPISNLKEEKTNAKERFTELTSGFKFIFKSKRLHALFLFAALFYGICSLSSLYIKTYLNDANVNSTLFGYIFAVASVASAIGSSLQEKIEKRFRNKTLSAVSFIYISTFIVLGVVSLLTKNYMVLLIAGAVIYLVQSYIRGAYRIIIKTYVSRYTTSSIRSKLMSIYYLAESFGSATLLFVTSSIMDSVSIGLVYTMSGFALSIVLIAVLNYMESRVGLKPENYGKSDRMDLQEQDN